MKLFGKPEIFEALLETPAAKAVIAAEAKRIADERRKNAADLEALHNRAGAAFQENLREDEEAVKACKAAEAALKAAGQRLVAIRTKRAGSAYELQRERDRLEAALIGSADPAIDAFVREMWTQWELAQKTPARIIEETLRNPNTGRVVHTSRPDGITPFQRMTAIRTAIAAAEEMKLESDQSSVPARLDKLRQALPTVGAPRE